HLEIVSSGSEVLPALRRDTAYDVLLLDLNAPEMNGLEVLREIRLNLKMDLPVVLLCRNEEADLAQQALRLGASMYLVKRPGYLYQVPWEIEEAYSRADLLRRETALERSEARNRALLNAIPDLMFLLSRDGTYLDFHAKAPEDLLVPPEQFLGKKVS